MDELITKLFSRLKAKEWTLATAESCTGGQIASRVTDVAGSSEFFDRGFVTYSNDSKTRQLGVPAALIDEFGAVSKEVAEAMAKGTLEHSKAQIAVSVTGIAGPSGGTPEKPVGLVYIGVATWDGAKVYEHRFSGDRAAIRAQTVAHALEYVTEACA